VGVESEINDDQHGVDPNSNSEKTRLQTPSQPANPRPGYGFSEGREIQPAPVPLPVTRTGYKTLDNPYVCLVGYMGVHDGADMGARD